MRLASLRKKYQRAEKRYGNETFVGIRWYFMQFHLGKVMWFSWNKRTQQPVTYLNIREKD